MTQIMPPWYQLPSTCNTPKNAIIIGAGIAGTGVAYALSKRGFDITIIDKAPKPAMGASSQKIAVLAPACAPKEDAIGQWVMEGFSYTRALLERLDHVDYDLCGVARITDKNRKPEDDIGADEISLLSASQSKAIIGAALSQDSYLYRNAGWVNPASLIKALLEQTKHRWIGETEITKLSFNNNQWHLNAGQKEIAKAPLVIIAHGAGRLPLLETLSLEPVRGQMEYSAPFAPKLTAIITGSGYVSPVINEIQAMGATYSRGDRALDTRKSDTQENLLRSQKLLPKTELNNNTPIAGIRCSSYDRRAIIGPLPDEIFYREAYSDLKHGKAAANYQAARYHPGLYCSLAHGSRGMCTGLLGGEFLAKMIEGNITPADHKRVELLHPARFIIRELRKEYA